MVANIPRILLGLLSNILRVWKKYYIFTISSSTRAL